MTIHFESIFEEGYRARREGQVARSRAVFLDAVRKAAEEGEPSSLAEALCGLAQAETDIGNCQAAQHHYASAAVLYRRVGPQSRVAFAIRHEADLLRQMHHISEAEPLYREAQSIYRQGGQKHFLDLANTLRGWAQVKDSLGEQDTAIPLWREARELYEGCDVQAGVAECDAHLPA